MSILVKKRRFLIISAHIFVWLETLKKETTNESQKERLSTHPTGGCGVHGIPSGRLETRWEAIERA